MRFAGRLSLQPVYTAFGPHAGASPGHMLHLLSLEVALPHSHVLLYIPQTVVINLEEPEV